MDKAVETIVKKAINYIEQAQPAIDDYNAFKDEIIKKAHESAAVLVSLGIMPEDKKAEFIDSIHTSPLRIFDYLQKVAKLVSIDDIGETTNIKIANKETALDAFERLALYGDPKATRAVSLFD